MKFVTQVRNIDVTLFYCKNFQTPRLILTIGLKHGLPRLKVRDPT
jgi:hypothetical protein